MRSTENKQQQEDLTMKHLDKVQLTTAMVIDFDDFRDIVYEVTDSKYDIEDDYGEIRFYPIDEAGEEIEDTDEDSDEIAHDIAVKLENYFEVQSICSFRPVSEYGSHEVMIPYIDY